VLTESQVRTARARTAATLEEAGFALTAAERDAIEIDDFGFSDLERIGLQSVVYVNTQRVCAKELVLFPGQTCPEHRHPPFGDNPGKEETYRCRTGLVYLYVAGEPTPAPACRPPRDDLGVYTARHEVVLRPGDQHSLPPNVPHWLQAGPEGAIVSEFATHCPPGVDVFTDPEVEPETTIVPD
jgi:D-lyxose ketol-isomerase